MTPESLEAIAVKWSKLTNEQVSNEIVGALIMCKGNLNRYAITLELMLGIFERVVELRKL